MITGELQFDPELRFTPSGTPLCTFRVIDTETGEITNCQAWRELGERIADNPLLYKRGEKVTLLGHYETREFGGQKRKEYVVKSIRPG